MPILKLQRPNVATSIAGLAFLLLAACSQAQAPDISWPDGKQAAIALTYDDSLVSQIETAIPALDAHGLKGTFYLTIDYPGFTERTKAWRAAAENGHELGNHTLYHPCIGPPAFADRTWVTPDRDLANYSVERMVKELTVTNTVLNLVDGQSVRTFAYTCGDMSAGGESFVEALQPLVISARSVDNKPGKLDLATLNPYALQSFVVDGHSGEDLITMAEQIRASGGFGTFTFHGVGAEYIAVSSEAHGELLAYLAANQDAYWVDTVRNISLHLQGD